MVFNVFLCAMTSCKAINVKMFITIFVFFVLHLICPAHKIIGPSTENEFTLRGVVLWLWTFIQLWIIKAIIIIRHWIFNYRASNFSFVEKRMVCLIYHFTYHTSYINTQFLSSHTVCGRMWQNASWIMWGITETTASSGGRHKDRVVYTALFCTSFIESHMGYLLVI